MMVGVRMKREDMCVRLVMITVCTQEVNREMVDKAE